jgi:DNA (cytosine-5)-methyltransferase 1
MYSMVDLFAGCGGLSRGLAMTGAFATDFAVEIEPHFGRAFIANINGREGLPTPLFMDDILKLTSEPSELRAWLEKVELSTPGTLDVLVGGPPCQGFSRNGLRRYEESGQRFYDLPINHLYRAFLDVLEMTMPRVVMIENVREFLKAAGGKFRDDLFTRLEELGYKAEARIVCAADYGVPQMRYRMIVIAYRDGNFVNFPSPTHTPREEMDLFTSPYRTVLDAIGDLPEPTYRNKEDRVPYPEMAKLSEYARLLRSKTGWVSNHYARALSAKQVERLRAVGGGRMKDVSPDLQTKAFYGSAYGRLIWDRPALTITTWVYHVGSGRFGHPDDDRGITMREAARIQSFDDDFIFPPLINPVSRMIGNAVPPMLAKAFGVQIAQGLARMDTKIA